MFEKRLVGCNKRCLVGFINCFELVCLINCQPAISIQQTTTECNNNNNKTDVRHNVTATVGSKLKSEKMQLELEMCKMKQLARCWTVRVCVTICLCCVYVCVCVCLIVYPDTYTVCLTAKQIEICEMHS